MCVCFCVSVWPRSCHPILMCLLSSSVLLSLVWALIGSPHVDSLRLLEQNNGYSAPRVLMSPHVDFPHAHFCCTPELNLGCNNWFIKQLLRPAPGSYTTALSFCFLTVGGYKHLYLKHPVSENRSCINIWF